MAMYASNPAYAQGFANIAKAFIGDPADELIPYKQQLLQQQTDLATANAAKAALDQRELEKEMAGRDALAALYSGYNNKVAQMQGPLLPGQTPQRAFGPQVYDAMAPDIAAAIVSAGYKNPDMATLGSMLPGTTDAQAARNAIAAGKPVGKDSFFSTADRNANAAYDVPGGSREVRGDGTMITDINPVYLDKQKADAEKARQEASGGYKIPKMGAPESKLILGSLMKSFGYNDPGQFMQDITSDPALGRGLNEAITHGWEDSHGNVLATEGAAADYLNAIPKPESTHWFTANRRFEGAHPAAADVNPLAALTGPVAPAAPPQPAPVQSAPAPAPAAAPAAPNPQAEAVLGQARAAIKQGADPRAVAARLQKMGIDPGGL